MNRRHIGSSVRSSGEGVWALSCSLFENFTPSDEPTPKRLYTIGSSGAEEIFSFPQTHVQLLRRVIFSGHRTIRWWVSPGSSVAPTVRPTPIFFYRRFIRHYTKAWVLPVITVGGRPLLPTLSFHPPPPELVSSPYAVVYSPPVNLSRTRACAPPPPAIRARCRPPAPPLLAVSACAGCHTRARVSTASQFPTRRHRGDSSVCLEGCASKLLSTTAFSVLILMPW
jgi:hypothetical protein